MGIQTHDVFEDVRTYVTENVMSLRKGSYGKKLYLSDDSLEDVIIHSLTQKAEGVFLWVYLQLEHLCRVSGARQDRLIRDELGRLPPSLKETYIRMLNEIWSQLEHEKHIALNALMWVLHAKCPLSKKELQYGVTLSSDPDSDPECLNLVNLDFLFGSCKNLLVYDGGVVQMVHYSAKEFMMSFDSRSMGLQPSAIQEVHTSNEKLGFYCLSFLGRGSVHGNFSERYRFNFAGYAAQYFDAHLEDSEFSGILSEHCMDAIDDVFASPAHIARILRIRNPRPLSNESSKGSSWSVHLRDPRVLLYSTKLLTVRQVGAKYACGELPGNALHLAAARGDEDTTLYLIRNRLDTNIFDEWGTCALYYACELGHTNIVSLLVKFNADVNVACGFYGSPLQAASARGHEDIVQILLHQGAQNDLQIRDGDYWTALCAAKGMIIRR